jgi:hypothetical protein
MKPPQGYTASIQKGQVFLLKKILYCLKQAAAEWHSLLSQTFRELDFKAVDHSNCFWV